MNCYTSSDKKEIEKEEKTLQDFTAFYFKTRRVLIEKYDPQLYVNIYVIFTQNILESYKEKRTFTF